MAKDITQHRKKLFLAGALLVILGSFLPWECSGDLVWYCSAGIGFRLPALSSAALDAFVMMVVILVAGSLIIGTIDSIRPWRSEIIIIFIISVVFYFLPDKSFIGGDGLIVIILCGIALWNVFRPERLTRPARRVATASTAALMLILACYLVYVLYHQIAERDWIGGTTLMFGLPMAFVGSLLMFVTRKWPVDVSPDLPESSDPSQAQDSAFGK